MFVILVSLSGKNDSRMKGPLVCCSSVSWNVNLVLVTCVSAVKIRIRFKFFSQIVWGQSP